MKSIGYLPLISSAFVLILGTWVLTRNYKSRLNILFMLFSLTIGTWLFGTYKMFVAQTDTQAIFWDRFIYGGVVFIPVFMHHFSLVFGKIKGQRKLLIAGYIVAVLFFILSRTDLFVKDLYRYQWGAHTIAQPAHHIFLLLFWMYVVILNWNIYRFYKTTANALEKNQARYVFTAFLVLFLVGACAYLPAYKIPVPPFPFSAGVFFSIILGYAIAKYSLLDIHFVIRKTVTNVILAIALFSLIWPTYTTNLDPWMRYLSIAVIAFLSSVYIPKLKELTEGKVTKIIYKDKYNYLDELKNFTHSAMVFILEEHKLLNEVAQKIYDLMKVKEVRIYLRQGTSRECIPVARAGGKIEKPPRPIEGLGECDDIFVPEEEMMMKPELVDTDISIRVPIVLKGSDVLGYITLGSKTTGEMFTHLDLELLKRIGVQLGIVLDYKKMEKYLREHESQEDIVQMIMELSHQFHNRLTSVETHFRVIARETKDNPKLKDYEQLSNLAIGDINAIFHKLRELAFFAHMDSPHPKDTELGEVVQRAVELKNEKLQKSNIHLERKEHAHLITIYCDGQLLTAAVGNILENAIWAVVEKQGQIQITTEILEKKTEAMKERCDEWVRIAIEDNGPGLSEESLQKAFDPFYTTKSREVEHDVAGFGLGLAIAKRICEAHGGYIEIKSKPGETVVTLDLPRKYKPLENAEKEKEKKEKEEKEKKEKSE